MPAKPKRRDIAVKIDTGVANVARIVAAYERVSLAELLSETLRPILKKRLDEHQKRSVVK